MKNGDCGHLKSICRFADTFTFFGFDTQIMKRREGLERFKILYSGKYTRVFRKEFEYCAWIVSNRGSVGRFTKGQRERGTSDVNTVSKAMHTFTVTTVSCTDLDNARAFICHDNLHMSRRVFHAEGTNTDCGTLS
ncbi:hypothetical protein D3C72_1935820 [compost metagenome]